jgi:hypothetical protein
MSLNELRFDAEVPRTDASDGSTSKPRKSASSVQALENLGGRYFYASISAMVLKI